MIGRYAEETTTGSWIWIRIRVHRNQTTFADSDTTDSTVWDTHEDTQSNYHDMEVYYAPTKQDSNQEVDEESVCQFVVRTPAYTVSNSQSNRGQSFKEQISERIRLLLLVYFVWRRAPCNVR